MAKRGKYRSYNETPKKRKVKESQKYIHRVSEPADTRGMKIDMGKQMYRRVLDERFKHYIGEQVIINRMIESNEKERTVGGVVVGLYPHFILLDCGFYKTTVSYKDLVLGV